jgi:hypothetical protein
MPNTIGVSVQGAMREDMTLVMLHSYLPGLLHIFHEEADKTGGVMYSGAFVRLLSSDVK